MSAPEAPRLDLASTEAGGKVIRGSVLRTGGYVAGLVLTAAASVFLLRYLGVVEFGRYVTVMSLIAIITGLTDVGLTVIGQREIAIQASPERRRAVLGNLVGIRLAITPIGVGAAVAFAAIAGYESRMVLGTFVAGVGLALTNTAITLTIPLSVELRFGALTATELLRQVVIVGGFFVLVLTGAGLVPFFAVQIAAGAAGLAATLAVVGHSGRVAPRFVGGEARRLLREAAPLALALVVNVVYLRLLIILTSLVGTGVQTGLFATSSRVTEIFVGVPAMMLGTAFPILAHAGDVDEERLAYALQRLGEVALLVAVGLAVVITIGAAPIVGLLGGEEYAPAAAVLQAQAWALPGAFMTQAWVLGLVAVRRQGALIATNAVALATVLPLGLILIPADGARGAAIAAIVGEAVLAVMTLAMLVRARPALRPRFAYAGKIAAIAAVCVLAGLLVPLPAAAAAVLAGAAYAAGAWMARTVPPEIVEQLLRRKAAA